MRDPIERLTEQAWTTLLEKDDRTSPEDYPDMVLISRDELADVITAARRAPTHDEDGPDLLDRRQRLAAAALLTAFDLPAPASAAAQQYLEASSICPGLMVGDVPIGSRDEGLRLAERLIAELLKAPAP